MPEKEFNLLYEPWISVMRPDGKTEEVSILEVFRHAPEWRGLAGELPTQDVAVLRLLLAILHAVFARHDVDGADSPIIRPADARRRWKALWDKGCFPAEVIETYLKKYEERFYLFHPQYPFYQVAELKGSTTATKYPAAKLNGEISKSAHKDRLFLQRTGVFQNSLRFAEAARWLLHLNGFDDVSGSGKGKGETKHEKYELGWLGKLGLIMAAGNTLFETLLLNLVLLNNNEECWGNDLPTWEEKTVKKDEGTDITVPNSQAALLTLQSRRLLLIREKNLVTGYLLLGGDQFSEDNVFAEQMTVWNKIPKKDIWQPKQHDVARQLWQDFDPLFSQSDNNPPGVVKWLAMLKNEELIANGYFNFQIMAFEYDNKKMSFKDSFSDSISFNANLLTVLGEKWVNRILAEIETSGRLAEQVGRLAQSLALAGGSDPDKSGEKRNQAKEQTYFQMDMPFRKWLEGIDPERDEKDEACDQWWKQAQKIARNLGRELVKQAGPQAFVGRSVKINGKESEYSAPLAYNHFLYCTSARETLIFKKGRR